MRYLKLIILVIIINSCDNYYPDEISKNNLKEEYDIAKWRMYTTNFRNKYAYFYDVKTPLNIVSCELHLEELVQKEDTIIFTFSFFYPDSNMTCMPGNERYINKIIFVDSLKFPFTVGAGLLHNPEIINNQKRAEKDTIESISSIAGTFYPFWSEQKSFEKFLKTTTHSLDPWLKKEAIKKGILKE